MAFDVNNHYTGSFYGKDRLGFTTPDCDASESLQPYLPVSYPAPWLPILRRDEAHPTAAGVVLSSHMAVGVDKSGGFVPAGYRSGDTGNGGPYCILVYGTDDVGFTMNPKTGAYVAAPGEYVVLAAPTDGAAGDTSASTTNASAVSAGSIPAGITITSGDLTFGHACDLIPGGTARMLGYVLRNAWQYIGGVDVASTTNGVKYAHDANNPTKFRVHNYMHEMGIAIRTDFVIRVPWIGATPTTLASLATTDGVAGYSQNDWSRSFTHFTGAAGSADGTLFSGCSVVASDLNGGRDAGHYAPFNSAKHKADQIIGRVLGVELRTEIKDYLNRVRTQFDRAQSFVGPFREMNPVQMMMGGSATRGLDYQLNLSGNGIFRLAADQNKTIHPEYGTFVYVKVRT